MLRHKRGVNWRMGAKAMYVDDVSTQENLVERGRLGSNYLVEVKNLINVIKKFAKAENDKELLYLSNMIYISVSDRIIIKNMEYE